MKLRYVAVWLALLVLWIHAPLFSSGDLLGAPRTDVLRAVWGLDVVARSLPHLPFWNDYIGFPVGVKVVVLPFFSALLSVPLRLFLGPIATYDVWVLTLLWGTGFATAVLAKRLTHSAGAGLLAGSFMVCQPMLFAALTDGTPEFVAFWSVPAALAALHAGRTNPRMAALAGGLLTVVALDSPYHAVFCAPFVPLVLWKMQRRSMLIVAGTALLGAGLLAFLYYGLPLAAPDDNLEGNAVTLRVWQQWESGSLSRNWDFTLGAGFIPLVSLAVGAGISVLRPVRALPWLLLALLCLAWGFSAVPENETLAWQWFGSYASSLARGISWWNHHAAPPVVRFPRRWLVPAAFGLSIAAAHGLSRIPWEWARAVIAAGLGAAATWKSVTLTGYREHLPHFAPPQPAFADYVRESDNDGAVLFLPRVRGARQATARDQLPVFASISPDVTSADLLWLQVECGRASVFAPNGLRTLTLRMSWGKELDKLLHDLDDLANPQTTGNPIPGSATQEPDRRARAAEALVDQGLGFVVIDEQVMGTEGVTLAKLPFAGRTVEDRHFDDGTGITVLVVE